MRTTVVVSIIIVLSYRSLAELAFESYRCGVDGPTRFVSFLMTSYCAQSEINMCCIRHDQCYSSCAVPQMTCDSEFCECLGALSANRFCRNFVHPSHCNTVQWFGSHYICPPMSQPLAQ